MKLHADPKQGKSLDISKFDVQFLAYIKCDITVRLCSYVVERIYIYTGPLKVQFLDSFQRVTSLNFKAHNLEFITEPWPTFSQRDHSGREFKGFWPMRMLSYNRVLAESQKVLF